MRRCCGTLFLIIVTVLTASAQKKLPAFSQYPAQVEKARITKIDFRKYPEARTYKTRLSSGLIQGVNFAGHFVIVGWGCGTGCTNAAVIDTRSGRVIWPNEFANVDATYGDGYSDIQIDFRKNSRLLIIHGRPGSFNENDPLPVSGDHYFIWNGARFRKVLTVEKSAN